MSALSWLKDSIREFFRKGDLLLLSRAGNSVQALGFPTPSSAGPAPTFQPGGALAEHGCVSEQDLGCLRRLLCSWGPTGLDS